MGMEDTIHHIILYNALNIHEPHPPDTAESTLRYATVLAPSSFALSCCADVQSGLHMQVHAAG